MPSEKTRGSGSTHATRGKKGGEGGGEDEVRMVREEKGEVKQK